MDKGSKTVLAVAVLLLLIVDCIAIYPLIDSGNEPEPGPYDPSGFREITDVRGRVVTIPNEIDRVVCIAAGSLRLMSYMGASDLVVGIDSSDSSKDTRNNYATYLIAYDYSSVPNVGDASNETSYKAIMETGAKIILTSKASIDELNTIQNMTGIPTISIDAGGDVTISDDKFRQNIELMGKILNKQDRAKQLLDAVDSFIIELASYSAVIVDKPSCYVGGLTYYKQSGLFMTSGNFMPFDLAGARNVMPYMSGLPYNIEIASRLIEAGPSYIFMDSMTRVASYNQYLENKAVLDSVPAIKEGKDYLLFASKYYGTNWETEIMNAYVVGQVVNPDSYTYNLREKLNAVLDAFFPNSDTSVTDIYDIQGWTPEEGWL